jgi:hypothetical protein
MNWLKSLSENLQKTTGYRSAIIEENNDFISEIHSPKVLLTITRRTFSDTEFESYHYNSY